MRLAGLEGFKAPRLYSIIFAGRIPEREAVDLFGLDLENNLLWHWSFLVSVLLVLPVLRSFRAQRTILSSSSSLSEGLVYLSCQILIPTKPYQEV